MRNFEGHDTYIHFMLFDRMGGIQVESDFQDSASQAVIFGKVDTFPFVNLNSHG
jgi:hypothetical protein